MKLPWIEEWPGGKEEHGEDRGVSDLFLKYEGVDRQEQVH